MRRCSLCHASGHYKKKCPVLRVAHRGARRRDAVAPVSMKESQLRNAKALQLLTQLQVCLCKLLHEPLPEQYLKYEVVDPATGERVLNNLSNRDDVLHMLQQVTPVGAAPPELSINSSHDQATLSISYAVPQ